MIDMKKSYTTRDGRPVRLLCVDDTEPCPIVGVMGNAPYRYIHDWRSDGTSPTDSKNDLIEVKTKRSGWINVFPSMRVGSHIYDSRDMAYCAASTAITQIYLEWEE